MKIYSYLIADLNALLKCTYKCLTHSYTLWNTKLINIRLQLNYFLFYSSIVYTYFISTLLHNIIIIIANGTNKTTALHDTSPLVRSTITLSAVLDFIIRVVSKYIIIQIETIPVVPARITARPRAFSFLCD